MENNEPQEVEATEVVAEAVETPAEQVVETAEAPAEVAPVIVKIAGKEFDLSTELGRIQAQAWGEAFSAALGRQGNELGELRKFKSQMAPTKDEAELLAKAQQLREEGDHRSADQLLFGYAKQVQADAQRKLELERENDRTWKAYFKQRPELTATFDEETIRTVSETRLGIYDSQDPFSVLDGFWLPKVPQKPQATATRSTAPSDKPLMSPKGSAPKAPQAKPKQEAPKAPSWEEVLDAHSVYAIKK